MKYYAIIVAGGTGSRMQHTVPKQFMLLNNRPVLMYSLEAFFHSVYKPALILVLPPACRPEWDLLCNKHDFQIPHQVVDGGATRYHSVKNGLRLVADTNSVTAIHDGARPLVSADIIARNYEAAQQNGNAITAIKSSDSIRQLINNTSKALNRESIYRVQTPQAFRSPILLEAYEHPYEEGFTDDASVVEKAGNEIFMTEGDPANIKITYPEDLQIAEVLLNLQNKKRP